MVGTKTSKVISKDVTRLRFAMNAMTKTLYTDKGGVCDPPGHRFCSYVCALPITTE